MSYINTSQASKILGVSKKTLFRWDKAGKFLPSTREKLSRGRVYKRKDVLNLKKLQEHEIRFQNSLNSINKIQKELNPYTNSNQMMISNREGRLLERWTILLKEHKKVVAEFFTFSPEIRKLFKQFYMREK